MTSKKHRSSYSFSCILYQGGTISVFGILAERCMLQAGFVLILSLFFSARAISFSYSGRVVNQSSQAIASARVWLAGTSLFTYTNNNGEFTLVGDSAATIVSEHRADSRSIMQWRGGSIRIDNPLGRTISAGLFSPDGRLVASRGPVTDPTVLLRLTDRLTPAGMLFAHVNIDDRTYAVRLMTAGDGAASFETGILGRENRDLAQTAAQYPLSATAPGYRTAALSIDQPTASNLVLTLTAQTSDSLGKFQKYYEGSGAINDLSTGTLRWLPIEQRIHVVVFGEGYTAADLSAGKYESDLARWYAEVFRVAPLSYFREAFVIWKYPIASNAHPVSDAQADTYFKIQVAGGSISSSLDSTSAIMWRTIAGQFPNLPTQYYPSGGNTSRLAKNMTVSFMVYDQRYGRSGFSGITTSLANPANANQRMATAFALDQHHEFLHALARLGDEYYDEAYGPLSSSSLRQESAYFSNVVSSAKCDSVPWKHLLYGGEYNKTTDSLVGAFGTNGRYHAEFKCLLNGWHDNAALYGGDGGLRSTDRMCNWCRELTAFRIYERSMVLDNTTTSWTTWVAGYRPAFYRIIGFSAPSVIPQQTSEKKTWFIPCQVVPAS
jgi:hypothetical protein